MIPTHSGSERLPRLRRLLFVLACLQVFAPAVAAIVDSWSLDRRVAYAHIESETGSGCVVVHAHDCVLCTIATTPMARPAARHAVVAPVRCEPVNAPVLVAARSTGPSAATASRAPPASLS